ncbi:hypothetical protein [Chengkuizengella sediminis]|uniref:hypothetical protein n=1 Tax=Chengkuizengella sediminis TaxID=1885917 RepID=UPI001389E551|nr:hypothetical protein [Chengkuizengella sediminis]NDI35465.1 hypothetical protein [Chengkuizengella sediminis]
MNENKFLFFLRGVIITLAILGFVIGILAGLGMANYINDMPGRFLFDYDEKTFYWSAAIGSWILTFLICLFFWCMLEIIGYLDRLYFNSEQVRKERENN